MTVAEAPSLAALSPTASARNAKLRTNPTPLAQAFAAFDVENYHEWAWANYKRVVGGLCDRFGTRQMLEIGGGRDPLFSLAEIAQLGAAMTVNDIAPTELAVLPNGYRTACFDVAGDISGVADLHGRFDLIFSRMVFEHVADGQRAWNNLYQLLAPGGIALAFIPTLYSLPFVLNRLLPDTVAAATVKLIYHHRTNEDDPVFPARYSWCFADKARMTAMLAAAGYRDVVVQPFYGHGYYRSFPVVRDVNEWFTAIARRRDWHLLASFAYIAARK